MQTVMLIAAILIVSIAHLVRVFRWSLFVENYEKPSYKNLITSLSIGYIINYFIPFKAGDLVRAFLAGRKMKNGKGFALATVIIERFLDVLVVGIIFGVFYLSGMGGSEPKTFLGYCVLAAVFALLLVAAVLLRKPLKKAIRLFSSMFNDFLEGKLLQFFWALIWGFKDAAKKISKVKLLVSTVIMWGMYLCSYWCFAHSMGEGEWESVFVSLFGVKALFASQITLDATTIWYAIYLLAPSALLLLIAMMAPGNLSEAQSQSDEEEHRLNLIPHVNSEDRKNFLELYFSGKDPKYVNNYLTINRKIMVLRDCSAGSNAITILCNSGGDNFYRKYAFGEDGKKLKAQIDWINRYRDVLPLTEVLKQEYSDEYCYYDMPFNSNAIGLFDYAHSAPKESAWNFMVSAFECLEQSIYQQNVMACDRATIASYVEEKVQKNLKKIYEASYIKPLMKYDTIVINGKEYKNLRAFEKYLTAEYLYGIFKNDSYTDIHGDLTIENIICVKNPNGEDSFYMIDPNTGNIHNSSNLDYAKMLQSIHGNYEFLMAAKNVEQDGNRIEFRCIRSDAYDYLLKRMDEYMKEKFTPERIKSIYYHEVIHWLRLMPYKIRHNGQGVLLFYAGLIMVLNDVEERFES